MRSSNKISEEDKEKLSVFKQEVEKQFGQRKESQPIKGRIKNFDFTMEQSRLASGNKKANDNILKIIDNEISSGDEAKSESELVKQAGKKFADKLFEEFEKDETETQPGRKPEPEKNLKRYSGDAKRGLSMVTTPLSIPLLSPVVGLFAGGIAGGTRAAVKVNEKVEHTLPRRNTNFKDRPKRYFDSPDKQVEVVLREKIWNEEGKVKTIIGVVTEEKKENKTPTWKKRVKKTEAQLINGVSNTAEKSVVGAAIFGGAVVGGVVGTVAAPFMAVGYSTAYRSEENSSNFPDYPNNKGNVKLTPKNRFIENYEKEQSSFTEKVQAADSVKEANRS